MRNSIIATCASFGLICSLIVGFSIDIEVWNQIGPKEGRFAILGLVLTTIGGVFYSWKDLSIVGISLILMGFSFEAIPQLKHLMRETDQSEHQQAYQNEKQKFFLEEGQKITEETWSPRPRSNREIEADIDVVLNKYIPKYGNTVQNLTQGCTVGHKNWRAWKYCNRLGPLKQELARAGAFDQRDKRLDLTYKRADEIKIEGSNLAFAKWISRWPRIRQFEFDPLGIESFVTFARILILHLATALCAHQTILNHPKYSGSTEFSKRFSTSLTVKIPASSKLALTTKRSDDSLMLVKLMLDEVFIRDPGFSLYFKDIHLLHLQWFSDRGYSPLTPQMLGRKLVEAGLKKNATGDRRYSGVRPKE